MKGALRTNQYLACRRLEERRDELQNVSTAGSFYRDRTTFGSNSRQRLARLFDDASSSDHWPHGPRNSPISTGQVFTHRHLLRQLGVLKRYHKYAAERTTETKSEAVLQCRESDAPAVLPVEERAKVDHGAARILLPATWERQGL